MRLNEQYRDNPKAPGAFIRFLRIVIMSVVLSGGLALNIAFAGICQDEDYGPLFTCETEREGKHISICAKEEAAGEKWSAVQYQFGKEGHPEMVFPSDPEKGSTSLFFSHELSGGWYRVSVRFRVGNYSYKVYSHARGEREGDAGVLVTDQRGKTIADIKCAERPYMFPSYLQRALSCDIKNPHGKAACNDRPYRK